MGETDGDIIPGFNDMHYDEREQHNARQQSNFSDRLAQMPLRNQVQLSAYGDSFGKNLSDLSKFVHEHLRGAIGGIHLLPIYPASGDGGFAPLCYTTVDPKYGTWDDVKALSKDFDLCLEFMVNHLSPKSDQFKDFIAKGEKSEFAEMFIDWEKFWPNGHPSKEEQAKIRTRKPEAPMIEVRMADGSKKKVWSTFGPEQMDINPNSKAGWQFVEESIGALCENGARVIRLDAFGYFTKKPGTPCFNEEPEVWDLLAKIENVAEEHGTRLLCEVHEEFKTNLKIAEKGYWVYDFALPLLVLHAFHKCTAKNLRNWLKICPRRQITVLDTHDGMGIDDIEGLADVCDTDELRKIAKEAEEKNQVAVTNKFLYDPEKDKYVGKAHQINCTYYSAVEAEDHSYLLARAIQFFCPGIPLVYYVGMLAGRNDDKGVAESGSGRNINRHKYSLEEAVEQVKRPVVKALLDLCRFRNQHPAFSGSIHVDDSEEGHVLKVTWENEGQRATLAADLTEKSFEIRYSKEGDKAGDDLHVVKFEVNKEVDRQDEEALDTKVKVSSAREDVTVANA